MTDIAVLSVISLERITSCTIIIRFLCLFHLVSRRDYISKTPTSEPERKAARRETMANAETVQVQKDILEALKQQTKLLGALGAFDEKAVVFDEKSLCFR